MHRGLFLLPVVFFVAMSGFLVSYDAATAPAAMPARVYVQEMPERESGGAESDHADAAKTPPAANPQDDAGNAGLPVLLAYPELEDVLINVNEATAAELEKLPGIGPAKAAAIVEYVRANGPLESVDELLEVKGIGEKILEKIRPYVQI